MIEENIRFVIQFLVVPCLLYLWRLDKHVDRLPDKIALMMREEFLSKEDAKEIYQKRGSR